MDGPFCRNPKCFGLNGMSIFLLLVSYKSSTWNHQRLKIIMISKSLDGASMFILDFVDWLGSFLWQRGVFGYSLHLITVLAPLYALCVLVCLFLLGIVNNILVCLSREIERRI